MRCAWCDEPSIDSICGNCDHHVEPTWKEAFHIALIAFAPLIATVVGIVVYAKVFR